MKHLKLFLFASFTLLLLSCGGKKPKFIKSALDNIITTYIDVDNYSVILADMDYKEDTDSYFHKYKIIIEKKNKSEIPEENFDVINTDWKKVSPISFEEHQNDLGMTVLSKKNGVLEKTTKPAGYDKYVGNKKYGSWQTNSSGGSFWAFYGQYRFMSSLFYGPSYRYYRNDYDHYRTYGRGTNYYGKTRNFGTKTYKNSNSSWASKPQTFKSTVNSKVKQSANALRSKGYSSSRSYKGNQTSRNSNRYNNSGSSRSRSGGFGK